MFSKIKKRDGRIVDFDPEKIFQAIWKTVQSVGGEDQEKAKFLTKEIDEQNKVVRLLDFGHHDKIY